MSKICDTSYEKIPRSRLPDGGAEMILCPLCCQLVRVLVPWDGSLSRCRYSYHEYGG